MLSVTKRLGESNVQLEYSMRTCSVCRLNQSQSLKTTWKEYPMLAWYHLISLGIWQLKVLQLARFLWIVRWTVTSGKSRAVFSRVHSGERILEWARCVHNPDWRFAEWFRQYVAGQQLVMTGRGGHSTYIFAYTPTHVNRSGSRNAVHIADATTYLGCWSPPHIVNRHCWTIFIGSNRFTRKDLTIKMLTSCWAPCFTLNSGYLKLENANKLIAVYSAVIHVVLLFYSIFILMGGQSDAFFSPFFEFSRKSMYTLAMLTILYCIFYIIMCSLGLLHAIKKVT